MMDFVIVNAAPRKKNLLDTRGETRRVHEALKCKSSMVNVTGLKMCRSCAFGTSG